LLIFLLSISCAPTRLTKPQIPHKPDLMEEMRYSIQKGDSLWKIAKRYNISIEEIMKKNKISSPQNLKIGQKIFLPLRRFAKTNTPFLWPVQGDIVNYFGENVDYSINKGLNISVNPANKNVKASTGGKIVFSSPLKGWGQTVILKHASEYYTIYANLDNAAVKEGAFAKTGQIIGEVASGKKGNYVFHFEIRKKNIAKDPLRYLN